MPQPDPIDWSRELSVAQDLARRAGATILEHYGRGADVGVDYKDARQTDPVTEADKAANRLIVEGLREAFPEDGILAEESADSAERLTRSRLWCVDPLDGTREFLDRNGMFVVMIGLAVEGASRLGVVYQPTEDRLWWGADDRAVEIRSDGGELPLRVSSVTDPTEATLMVSRSHRSEAMGKVAESIGVEREFPMGSVGLKAASLATTAGDIYISLTNKTREWDACAPEAVLRGAGGMMTDLRGDPLVYNKDDTRTVFGMLASNGRLHARCVDVLEELRRQRG